MYAYTYTATQYKTVGYNTTQEHIFIHIILQHNIIWHDITHTQIYI